MKQNRRTLPARVGLILALAIGGPACSPAGSDDAKDDKAMMQLAQITTLTESENRLQIILEGVGTITLVEDENGVLLERDRVWLQDADARGVPVAYDPETQSIHPATVAISIETRSGDEGMKVFAPPRPGIMALSKDHPDYARLEALLDEAAKNRSGAVFALRDALTIEDAVLVSADQSLHMLGMVPTE